MITNCKGCECELCIAYDYQEEGLHLVQQELTHIGERSHFIMMLVNDEGKVVVWQWRLKWKKYNNNDFENEDEDAD